MYDLEWYIDYFAKELAVCKNNFFTGAIRFEVNFREGNIGNMNMEVKQSVKKEAFHGKSGAAA